MLKSHQEAEKLIRKKTLETSLWAFGVCLMGKLMLESYRELCETRTFDRTMQRIDDAGLMDQFGKYLKSKR